MKKIICILFLACCSVARSQDTFSILAFDSITREVGAAGASCVDLFPFPQFNNHFICELFPDTGAVACQAAYVQANQITCRQRMRAGDSPQQLIAYAQAYDVGAGPNDYQARQYGAVRLGSGFARTAAFTGTNCMNYKNHIVGPNYTIHGNILLGQQVLDSMQAGFLRERGDLACKLMAAMRGARMVGADSRCAGNNTSSLFAFLKVSLPMDTFGKPSFLISLRTHNGDSIEPIDSLQTLFDQARSCKLNNAGIGSLQQAGSELSVGQDVVRQILNIRWELLEGATIMVTDAAGREVLRQTASADIQAISTSGWAKGIYLLSITTETRRERKMVLVQ